MLGARARWRGWRLPTKDELFSLACRATTTPVDLARSLRKTRPVLTVTEKTRRHGFKLEVMLYADADGAAEPAGKTLTSEGPMRSVMRGAIAGVLLIASACAGDDGGGESGAVQARRVPAARAAQRRSGSMMPGVWAARRARPVRCPRVRAAAAGDAGTTAGEGGTPAVVTAAQVA